MAHHLTEAQWVDRFLSRLGELTPSIHAAGSRESAFQAYAEAGDIGPEEAAEAYLLEQSQGETGTET